MRKFWIIAVNGVAHMFSERFYSFTDAKKEAERRAKLSPYNTFMVLALQSYVEGASKVTVSWEGEDHEDITVLQNTPALISVELIDDDGEPLDLEGMQVQFIVLPYQDADDSQAIFNETKRWVAPEVDPYPYDGFKSNVVEYLITADYLKNTADYWYEVRITYDDKPEETELQQYGNFFITQGQ